MDDYENAHAARQHRFGGPHRHRAPCPPTRCRLHSTAQHNTTQHKRGSLVFLGSWFISNQILGNSGVFSLGQNSTNLNVVALLRPLPSVWCRLLLPTSQRPAVAAAAAAGAAAAAAVAVARPGLPGHGLLLHGLPRHGLPWHGHLRHGLPGHGLPSMCNDTCRDRYSSRCSDVPVNRAVGGGGKGGDTHMYSPIYVCKYLRECVHASVSLSAP